jgi:para-nitrobenzyl esterase
MATMGRRSAVEATTTTGKVRGRLEAGGAMAVFRGIPYAAPPVGPLRWRPPVTHEPWRGTRSCTKFGPDAYQRSAGFERFFANLVVGLGLGPVRRRALAAGLKMSPAKQSEDCLTLNIRVPAHAENLPVMVWIHGGDHTDGSASEPLYQSDALPERGCVLVTVNYRLGLFGFFAHPDLAGESPDGVSGNYGLLDQIAALQWVRDNIARFGGDPGNVTIFGESAGGEAVLNLLTSSRARGLFHRAIAQSPSDSGRWLHLRRPALDFDPAEEAGVAFASLVVGSTAGQVGRLREIGPEALYDVYRSHPEVGRYFYPVVDDVILPATPMSAFTDQQQASVPLMIGYNNDEGSILAPFSHPAGAEFPAPTEGITISPGEARAAFERSYPSPQHVDRLMAAYPGLASLDPRALEAHLGDHMFGVHVDHASRQHAAGGNAVYRYHFRSVPPSKKQTIGAFHAAEILHVFDTKLPLVPVAPDAHLLTREMGDRWFAFAATGVPDSPGRIQWPAFDPGDPHHMVFDRPTSCVQTCTAKPGLDVMRERTHWLTERLRPGAADASAAATSTGDVVAVDDQSETTLA